MLAWVLLAVLTALPAACAGGERERAGNGEPLARPGTGPAYSVVYPTPEAEERATDFRGSCDFARPPGAATEYRVVLRTRGRPGDTVGVRSEARFEGDGRDHMLGEVPSGIRLLGEGPLRAGGPAEGIGYAVLVRDPAGRICRGYVNRSRVEVLALGGPARAR